jgi:integrase/recombinase XerD
MGVPRLQVDEAAEAVVDAYRSYELIERRLGELTVTNACYLVRKFLAWRAARGRAPLECLGAGELHDYVRHEAGVQALLASCALERPVGRRDHAILLLMVRLGLRAVEIARMQLGDIDWRAGVIEVRGKGGRRDRLPLPADVGQALADYLSKARRASSCRSVFLQASGEPVGMSRNAVVFVSAHRVGEGRDPGRRRAPAAAHGRNRAASSRREPARGRRGVAPGRSDDDLRLREDRRAVAAVGGPAVAGEVSAMTSLADHLDRYLAVRRSVGYQLEEHGRVLPDFVRYAQSTGETTVRTQTALAWVAGASSDGQRGRRLSMVRGFARYLLAFDPATEIPPRGLGPDSQARSVPHIYSNDEIARLMNAAIALEPASFGVTMQALIGLIASTGLRPGETWRLDRQHVDLAGGQLTVWHSKFGRSRRLPLHESTVKALADYSMLRDRAHPQPSTEAFFLSPTGARLTSAVVSRAFRELRRRASIVTPVGQGPAVLGDLRHTFAVSTLLAWHRAGVDVQRQLPILSAFLGHVNPRQTFWYLEGTPELMALVAERLESWEAGR